MTTWTRTLWWNVTHTLIRSRMRNSFLILSPDCRGRLLLCFVSQYMALFLPWLSIGYFICCILSNTTQMYLHKPCAVILLSVKLGQTDISAVYLSWPHWPCGCSWFYNCSVQLPCILQHSCSVSLTEARHLQWPSTCCGLLVWTNEPHFIMCFVNVFLSPAAIIQDRKSVV